MTGVFFDLFYVKMRPITLKYGYGLSKVWANKKTQLLAIAFFCFSIFYFSNDTDSFNHFSFQSLS